MKWKDLVTLSKNPQERLGVILIIVAQFFAIFDSIYSRYIMDSTNTIVISNWTIASPIVAIIGLFLIYDSKKRLGTLNELKPALKFAIYVGGLGILLGLIIFLIYFLN